MSIDCWMIVRFVDPLIESLVHWLIDSLIENDWLIDYDDNETDA